MTNPGYALAAPVCDTGDLVLSRAIRVRDGLPVLLKTPSDARPTPALLRRLEREYELTGGLDPWLIARPLALEHRGGTATLVLEHGPTRTLVDLLGSPIGVEPFLRVAMGVTVALAEIHRHDLVHKDIKPEHVLLDADGHVRRNSLPGLHLH